MSKYLNLSREKQRAEAKPPPLTAPKIAPTRSPFASVEILNACHARGIETTSYGWPVCYWPGDFRAELDAWYAREPPTNPELMEEEL